MCGVSLWNVTFKSNLSYGEFLWIFIIKKKSNAKQKKDLLVERFEEYFGYESQLTNDSSQRKNLHHSKAFWSQCQTGKNIRVYFVSCICKYPHWYFIPSKETLYYYYISFRYLGYGGTHTHTHTENGTVLNFANHCHAEQNRRRNTFLDLWFKLHD